MKRKELKNLAKQIAKLEIKMSDMSLSEEERKQAEYETMYLSSRVNSFEELDLLDEMIQEDLRKDS